MCAPSLVGFSQANHLAKGEQNDVVRCNLVGFRKKHHSLGSNYYCTYVAYIMLCIQVTALC